MSPICTIIFVVSIFVLSSASTSLSPSISRLPISNSNSTRILQKSSNFCCASNNCESSQMGLHSTCVNNACICDFGYQKVSPSEKCTKIACSYNSDCLYLFSHSHCDLIGSCVCDIFYRVNTTTAQCEEKGCTHDDECFRLFTHCDAWNKCVCKSGYRKDSDGNCISTTSSIPSYDTSPVIITTAVVALLIIIVGVVLYIHSKMGLRR